MDLKYLKDLASETITRCTFMKTMQYNGTTEELLVLLPSGDECYTSFWIRDCVMMVESGLVPTDLVKKYIAIFASCGQNGKETRYLENGLIVPPYAVADHVNYNGRPVFYPGTYADGENQGNGSYGTYPPFCDNFFFVMLVDFYIAQSGDVHILQQKFDGIDLLTRMEYALKGYNIDAETELCRSDEDAFTVDWGFVDTIKKTGLLLMASLLRYRAALVLAKYTGESADKGTYYRELAKKISDNIMKVFYDTESGWLYSATGIGHQHDVWATAYAVCAGVLKEEKTYQALQKAYMEKTAIVNGCVRHILTTEDFSEKSAWEQTRTDKGSYQNGGYWATATGWYARALWDYDQEISNAILEDFIEHTKKYRLQGAPYEWINEDTTKFAGCGYGTSGVLPYTAFKDIF